MSTLCSPMLALEMLSPIAVTETAEVTTGLERGDDGVGTGESAVGAARLYNLRLPPKASGKDTGLVAGARIEGLPPVPPTPLLEGGGVGVSSKHTRGWFHRTETQDHCRAVSWFCCHTRTHQA